MATKKKNDDIWAEGAFNIKETCKFLGIERTTLYKLFEEGRLTRGTIGRRVIVPRADCRRLLAESTDLEAVG